MLFSTLNSRFIQHCATYTDEDNADGRSNDSRTANREEGTPTPSSATVTNTQPQSIWERREIPGHSGGKRLGVPTLTHASSDIIYSSSSSEPPPPPYHSICFNKFDKNKDIV